MELWGVAPDDFVQSGILATGEAEHVGPVEVIERRPGGLFFSLSGRVHGLTLMEKLTLPLPLGPS